MFTKLCFFLFIALFLFESSNSFKITSRIVNGADSSVGQFPYYAYLEIETPNEIKACGGSLIDNQWILTAAHCIHDAEEVLIELGTHEVRNRQELGRVTVTASSKNIYLHPFYVKSLSWNDIGLIKLPKSVEFSAFVRPISLPITCDSNERKKAIVMGHGLTSETSRRLPDVLQYASLKTLSMAECKQTFPFLILRKSVICAFGESGQSVCTGDSGSPLVSENILIGISSFIHSANCDAGLAQGFTDVLPYLSWIGRTTGQSLPRC